MTTTETPEALIFSLVMYSPQSQCVALVCMSLHLFSRKSIRFAESVGLQQAVWACYAAEVVNGFL